MSSEYWLGVLTLPALALASWLVVTCWFAALDALASVGIVFELKKRRDLKGISGYRLRHDIWWERSRGPVFYGGWCFDRNDQTMVNRWIGLGSADGPCLMVFKKIALPCVTSPEVGEG